MQHSLIQMVILLRCVSLAARLSSLGDMSAISVTHVNDTKMNDTMASLPPRQSLSSKHVSPAELQAIDCLNLTAVNNDMFLDGCQVKSARSPFKHVIHVMNITVCAYKYFIIIRSCHSLTVFCQS